MTIRLHRKPGAGSLYVAVLCGVLGLGLGGCAGESDGDGDDGDDAEGVIGTPMSGPASDAPAQDPSPADEPRGEAAHKYAGVGTDIRQRACVDLRKCRSL